MTRLLPALLILGLTTGVVAARHIADAVAAAGQGAERVGLRELAAGVEACQRASWPDAGAAGYPCVHLAYVWSPSMPLSEIGIEEARRAAGATVHYPSLVVLRSGEAVGSAIVGYKLAEAYRALLPDPRGLEFYVAAEVFEQGRSGGAEDVDPLVTDRRMRDQYPSVGILETDEDARATRYRVLVSWFSGLALRDYDVRWDGSGISALTPAGPRLEGCPGKDLSTPMLSRNGRELAARDEHTGTTKVFRLEDDGSCRELFDLGRQYQWRQRGRDFGGAGQERRLLRSVGTLV